MVWKSTKKPEVNVQYPVNGGKFEITMVPILKDTKISREKLSEGLKGVYSVKYALSIPGKSFYIENTNLSKFADSGESQIILSPNLKIHLKDKINPNIKDAYLLTNEEGILTTIIIKIWAENFNDAQKNAHNFTTSLLSWLSLFADVGIDIKVCEITQDDTKTQHWRFNTVGAKKIIDMDDTENFSIGPISPTFRKLMAAYREGLSGTNSFYKFLCFWKVIEGCKAYNKQRNRKLKRSTGTVDFTKEDRIPNVLEEPEILNEETKNFQPFIGKKFSQVLVEMREILRNSIAHLIPGKNIMDSDDFDNIAICDFAIPVVKYMSRILLIREARLDGVPLYNS